MVGPLHPAVDRLLTAAAVTGVYLAPNFVIVVVQTAAVGMIGLEQMAHRESLDTYWFLRAVVKAVDELEKILQTVLALEKAAGPGLPAKTAIQAGYFAESAQLHPDFVDLAQIVAAPARHKSAGLVVIVVDME